jgi:hypothetical protein
METKPTPGHFLRLHVFVFFVAYLWTMITLDAVYVFLLFHGWTRQQLDARRERLAMQHLDLQHTLQPTESTAFPALSANASSLSDVDGVMDSDMPQAA